MQLFRFLRAIFYCNFYQVLRKCNSVIKKYTTKLFQFSSILFDCMKQNWQSYMTDYLRHNVIYDETVGLQVRSFTTPAKYGSARTQLEVEERKILAFGQVRANENRLCQVFRSQMCA